MRIDLHNQLIKDVLIKAEKNRQQTAEQEYDRGYHQAVADFWLHICDEFEEIDSTDCIGLMDILSIARKLNGVEEK